MIKKLHFFLFALMATALFGQELTIKQGDSVTIRAEQVTERSDNTPLLFGDRIFYTLRTINSDGIVAILGGIDHTELSYPTDRVMNIKIETAINDKVGTHKIQGFHHRKPAGQESEYLSKMTELTLIVETKTDTLAGKAWAVDFHIL